jgi:pimeloyl-ACP methyl ester carboxylesterase
LIRARNARAPLGAIGTGLRIFAAMAKSGLKGALGIAALALGLVACGFKAGDPADGPWFARLGPPEAPLRLFFEDKGEGPPVLLIHGFGTSTFTWRHVAPQLARHHRVIAVDLKGFGQSDKPFDDRYSVFDQAQLLIQLIEKEDLHNLTIIGHSYGGGVALVLALHADTRLKGRISKLVLLDTIAYPQHIPVFFRMLDIPVISHIGVRMVPPSLETRIALQIAYLDNGKIDDAEVEAYAAPLRTAAGKYAIIQSARQIMPQGMGEIAERYKSIKLPTLILWCDHDRIVPLDVGLKLRRTMPNSSLKIVRSCGHMPQEEQPEQTLSLIRDFLGG